MPIITKVETTLTYWNRQYDIPESLFVKHFGSFEAFEKNHTDDQGMIIESPAIYDFLDSLSEEIMIAGDCLESHQIESEKHDSLQEYFLGKVVKYDRRVERKG